MKKMQMLLFGLFAIGLLFCGCQRESKQSLPANHDPVLTSRPVIPPGACNSNAYVITLESKTLVGGNWEWVWSVRNPNPGNGLNGTVQDLSHWGMQFGDCFLWSDVVGAAISRNGNNWANFTPRYEVDPSQDCVTTPVLKFDTGTTGSAKTYYKLILKKDYTTGSSDGYYKSGVRMPCCTFKFQGIGCVQIPT